ncbi:GntR family transcriptional regulator [Pseudonocardia sp. HH130629-09]|uniref:GntR family transcriptional regulator n=1 Tax=Pseudonocardia sp. HH130629-09 TaxID=1641402 RepID=UPI000761005D|nr:GntR family transcriptional regulator [Pseudonocardia sp. HH130629-09]
MSTPTPADLQKLDQVESLADRAYNVLREGIATGVFAPGERVTERGLAARLGVSPTPVREALRKLEHERLIVRLGPRRLAVAEHSDRDLRGLMHVEVVLRAAQARLATDRIDDETVEELAAIVDEIENPSTEDPADQQRRAHRFDEVLTAVADNPMLDQMIVGASLFGAERRARSLARMQQDPEIRQHRVIAHRHVLDALRRRDPNAVEDAMRAHLSHVMDFLLTID